MKQGNVGEFTIKTLFEQDFSIPPYQRPYAWSEEQVKQLLLDLIEAKKNNKIYLIGNMILYQNNGSLEIVDGQQRITTLALLLNILRVEDLKFLEKSINVLSKKRIIDNYRIIDNFFQNYQNKEGFKNFLLEKVIITYTKTDDLDEAFILFDSQNTRGKPLKRKDILKVHHIHPIREKRSMYAKKWEAWERNKTDTKKESDRLDEILYLISFIRKGIRNELGIDDLDSIDVFRELKTKTASYHLNNYNQPPIYESFEFDFEKNLLSLITKPIKFSDRYLVNGIKYVPFEINSAISGGENFFMYTWKYYEIYLKLLENTFFTKLDSAYGSGNLYLKKIYQTSLFFYFDKFGNEKLEDFAIRIFILLLYLRINKSSIRKEKVLSQEWDNSKVLNFYKLILISYSAQEVIDTLDEYIRFNIDSNSIKQLKEEGQGQEIIKGTKKVFFKAFDKSLIIKILEGIK